MKVANLPDIFLNESVRKHKIIITDDDGCSESHAAIWFARHRRRRLWFIVISSFDLGIETIVRQTENCLDANVLYSKFQKSHMQWNMMYKLLKASNTEEA